MSQRIQKTFERLAGEGRKALVPYFTTGFPLPDSTVEVMHASAQAGADIIELGVPFSDPMADGPVIQRANERALAAGISMGDVLRAVAEFRRTDDDTPIVVMGYLNPIERLGFEKFARLAADAGVDGLITVDLPPEESEELSAAMSRVGIAPIFLIAPTSGPERIDAVARSAVGYVYYVSLKGITGAGHLDVASVREGVERIRERVSLPVGVGFGIRDARTANAIAGCADAVIIGTRMIQILDDGEPSEAPARAGAFIREIRAAIDAGSALGAAGLG